MNPTEMNEAKVEEIRKAWATETPQSPHYEHCYRSHAHCAIFALLDVVEFYRGLVAEGERELRAIGWAYYHDEFTEEAGEIAARYADSPVALARQGRGEEQKG